MTTVRERFNPFLSKEAQDRRYARADASGIIAQIRPFTPAVPVKVDTQAAWLITGEHRGFRTDKLNAVFSGVPGAKVVTQVTIENHASFCGIHFTLGSGGDPIIRVKSPAVAIFNKCDFQRPTTSGRTHIEVETGAQASFVGCRFIGGSGSAGNVIDNQGGVAADVQVIGGHNQTGNPMGTVATTGLL